VAAGRWHLDLCVSLPLSRHAELMRQSVALLRAGWEGVAMVEYRYDPASGRAALMEVNGASGAACRWPSRRRSFPWYCYQALGLGRPLPQAYRKACDAAT
jgi:hypothetical protein